MNIKLISMIILIMIGLILTISVSDMPVFADPDAPIHNHVAPRYIEKSYEEVGVINIVTAVVLGYRSYDTLGELIVIFTGGIAVISMLGHEEGDEG